jgi:hypothetical protein
MAVILVDTSIVHLGDTMDRPASVVLPFSCDWRWGVTGTTSRWYPTLRLFRQPDTGNCGAVID